MPCAAFKYRTQQSAMIPRGPRICAFDFRVNQKPSQPENHNDKRRRLLVGSAFTGKRKWLSNEKQRQRTVERACKALEGRSETLVENREDLAARHRVSVPDIPYRLRVEPW
eukprot:3149180-Rhodomonas_salina.2